MSEPPLVSVVVPCYDHATYLVEALRSIGTPSARTEIVVVDDGSRDSTPEVIAGFQTTNPFRSVRQRNAGLAAARNRGLRESRGEYVVFLDADDRLAPGAVDLGVAQLLAHPECAFVYGRCIMMDRSGQLVATPAQPRIVKGHYRELLLQNYIWMPAMAMFRRQPLERAGGFNPAVNAAADYEVYLHLARHYPVYDHGQVVAHYRKHDANMSDNAGRMLRETLAVLASQRPYLAGDAASLAAFAQGRRNWQEFYGARLAAELQAAVRGRHWIAAIHKAAVLGRYHPRGFWHHARRKTELVLRLRTYEEFDDQAGRATPAAEISAPSSRASSSPGKR